jgi:long-chain acyl-CoA synthetase
MNIAELTELEIKTCGEHVNVVYEGQEFTNVGMDRTSRRLGNGLKELGIKPGDRVMIQMPNSPEVMQSFQAISKIGAVVVPINYLIADDESAHIYRDSGARTIITSHEFLPRVEAARANAPEVKNVILTDK